MQGTSREVGKFYIIVQLPLGRGREHYQPCNICYDRSSYLLRCRSFAVERTVAETIGQGTSSRCYHRHHSNPIQTVRDGYDQQAQKRKKQAYSAQDGPAELIVY